MIRKIVRMLVFNAHDNMTSGKAVSVLRAKKAALTLRACAKINLYLDMVGRMDNGYHEIRSVMQSIGLYDKISFTLLPAGKGIKITSPCRDMPCDRRNLAYRAAEAFGEMTGIHPDVEIHIEKHIPMAAGMAGGSSDAAIVLRGLNRIFHTGKRVEELCALGKTLGADVPFCILGGAAIAGGVGEKLTPCAPLPAGLSIVVACGGSPVYTPAAYRDLDAKYGDFSSRRGNTERFDALVSALSAGDGRSAGACMYNIFEEVVLPAHDMAPLLLQTMREGGAMGAMMSGSGPTAFGLFETESAAGAMADRIAAEFGIAAEVVHPVGPYADDETFAGK